MKAILTLLGALVGVAVLAGCSSEVPVVTDPHHPTDFAGKPMTPTAFASRYCASEQTNKTCMAVVMAARQDSTRSALPAGW